MSTLSIRLLFVDLFTFISFFVYLIQYDSHFAKEYNGMISQNSLIAHVGPAE